MLEVIDISFDEVVGEMNPVDIYDFKEVVTINVGENGVGNLYYFVLVTNQSISIVKDKLSVYKIEKWEGVEALVVKLNSFIKEKLESNYKENPYVLLSKYWQWEYASNNS